MTPPITYPKITIPNKGTFTVKFGLGATFALEEMGVEMEAISKALQEWQPRKDPITGEVIPGKARPSFLLKVLSACIGDQIQITPRQLGDAFEMSDLGEIARVVAEAFTKMQPPAQARIQETVASQDQAPN